MKRTTILVVLAAGLALAGCSAEEDEPVVPVVPGNLPPAPLEEGQARLQSDTSTVAPGGTFEVHLDVHSGDSALGAFSTRLFFNRAAFELVSVDGTDPVLSDPYMSLETRPGSAYLAWTNTSPPDDTLTGERRVATLTFRAVGGAGSRLTLGGRLLGLGDTAFPGQPIGSGPYPRDLEVIGDVTIAAQ